MSGQYGGPWAYLLSLACESYSYCFPGGSVVKNLPAIQEMRVQSLGQEDPLVKEMATHSCILAWKIPWTKEPGGLQGSQESDKI